jgi:hypothetical protein
MKKAASPSSPSVDLRARHLRVGWWALFLFVTLGLALEGFHGLKVRFYMDAGESTRRFMWTLAHAHGTLLALVNLGFASLLGRGEGKGSAGPAGAIASACLVTATLTLPTGFFLGGIGFYGGDPSVGIVLVPLGGLALVVGIFLAARIASRPPE